MSSRACEGTCVRPLALALSRPPRSLPHSPRSEGVNGFAMYVLWGSEARDSKLKVKCMEVYQK